ncbi:MAG: ABC transporter substrate-binding protein [Arcobacter sp.]|nr:ABC transporter substrate-binding protein [Arcobacter sp.]
MRALCVLLLLFSVGFSQEKLKVGVLSFGTVNWELKTMKDNKFDKKNGVDVEVVKLASKNAVSTALLAKSVDLIVTDFIWVNRQRKKGFDFTFYPYSKAIGAMYARPELNINTLNDLEGKKLGISGGSVDKTWLIMRAFSKYKYNKDLKNMITPTFAAPPILNKKLLDKSLDATINFWHFGAKLKAKGMKKLIGLDDILPQFGIKNDISFIGWTFSEKFASKNKNLINGFLKASYETKQFLNEKDKEWNKIRPFMKAKSDSIFIALKNGYKNGIVKSFGKKNIEDTKKLYSLLAKEGGKKLIGDALVLDEKTFYEFNPNIKW